MVEHWSEIRWEVVAASVGEGAPNTRSELSSSSETGHVCFGHSHAARLS